MEKALIVLSGWSGDVTACPHAKNVRACYCIDCLQVRVALALEAERRSAHLQDARAGCSYCRLDKPVTQVGDGWEHIYKAGPSIPCARPEVWDALSLLPPKGTK